MRTNSIPVQGRGAAPGVSGYASLHTGPTAWHLLAARRVNPLSAPTPISAQ
jgi:hypothetical protein